ncbi:MAG: hypothetical protein HZA53_15045 [Planctomycetes bacterium]|nr:hypothetical protein [Planctomycetota bacterium]
MAKSKQLESCPIEPQIRHRHKDRYGRRVLVCTGTAVMVDTAVKDPDCGEYNESNSRGVAIYTPAYILEAGPEKLGLRISATLSSPGSVGEAFAIYQIDINPMEDQTQFAIWATKIGGDGSKLRWLCSYTITGSPAAPAAIVKASGKQPPKAAQGSQGAKAKPSGKQRRKGRRKSTG